MTKDLGLLEDAVQLSESRPLLKHILAVGKQFAGYRKWLDENNLLIIILKKGLLVVITSLLNARLVTSHMSSIGLIFVEFPGQSKTVIIFRPEIP